MSFNGTFLMQNVSTFLGATFAAKKLRVEIIREIKMELVKVDSVASPVGVLDDRAVKSVSV